MKVVAVDNFVGLGLGTDFCRYADATVESGWWLWKKREVRRIFRPLGLVYWRFLDNGAWTPGDQAEKLADAAEARKRAEAA